MAAISKASAFGYQPMEINWCIIEGVGILPAEFIGKPARWFRYNDENELVFRSRDRTTTTALPEDKFLVARNNPTFDNPYGKNYLGKCFWPVTFLCNGDKWFTIYTERFGVPWVKAKANDGVKEEDILTMAQTLADMTQDGVLAYEDNWDVDLIEAKAGNSTVHTSYLNHYSKEIAIAILSNNLTTSVEGGSLAAAGVHNEIRGDIVEADTRIVEDLFNELIVLTYNINEWDVTTAPTFILFDEADINTDQSVVDKNLKDANPNLQFKEKHYSKHYGFDEDEFEIVNSEQAITNID